MARRKGVRKRGRPKKKPMIRGKHRGRPKKEERADVGSGSYTGEMHCVCREIRESHSAIGKQRDSAEGYTCTCTDTGKKKRLKEVSIYTDNWKMTGGY